MSQFLGAAVIKEFNELNERHKNEFDELIKKQNEEYFNYGIVLFKSLNKNDLKARNKTELIDARPSELKENRNKEIINEGNYFIKITLSKLNNLDNNEKTDLINMFKTGSSVQYNIDPIKNEQFGRSMMFNIESYLIAYKSIYGSIPILNLSQNKNEETKEIKPKKKMKVTLSDGRVIEE